MNHLISLFLFSQKYSGHGDDNDDDYGDDDDDIKTAERAKHDGEEDASSIPDDDHGSAMPRKRAGSNLTFDYPVVLEFFQLKQELHDLISKIIMSTQSLTLEDPEVFKGLKTKTHCFITEMSCVFQRRRHLCCCLMFLSIK